jgi:hypothetical protein
MNKPNCIFHVPWKLSDLQNVASEIRPRKMLKAFHDIGYNVDIVWGNIKERKSSIEKIKTLITNGKKYEFMYCESSTLPNALTEDDHIPRAPFLDYSFFRFCKKNSIPIGLFYRDVYWNLSGFRRFNPIVDRIVNSFHKLDNFILFPFLKKLYLPSLEMKNFVPLVPENLKYSALPSGIELKEMKEVKNETFLYVGDVNSHIYDISVLFKVFSEIPEAKLIVNCRSKANDFIKNSYSEYLTSNIEIKNCHGEELIELYNKSTYTLLFFKPNLVRTFAAPYKQFEYAAYGKITIANIETHAGKFNVENNLGFSIPYSEDGLKKCIISVLKSDHIDLTNHIKDFAIENTWLKRAEKVVKDLRK